MDVPIMLPQIYGQRTNENLQVLGGGEDGLYTTTTVYPRSFVTTSAGVLVGSLVVSTAPVLSAGGTTVAGFLLDTPRTNFADTAVNPPATMHGENVSGTFRRTFYPELVAGLRFAMSTTGTTFQIGTAGSAPALSTAVIGTAYGLIIGGTSTPGTGQYAGYTAVNLSDTTNTVVRVVDIPKRYKLINQGTPASVFNGIVIVEVLDTKIVNL